LIPNFLARIDSEKFSSANSALSPYPCTTLLASKLAGSDRFQV
jgi:hypothetical protein